MKKVAIVIPTYNERENIEKLIGVLLKQNNGFSIYIVDDKSPDGTGALVDAIAEKEDRVQVLHRKKKEGLGKAYRYAFTHVCKDKPDYIVQMDADFSHDPMVINDMIANMKNYDVVIGSRYVNGISVLNWPIHRIFLSWGANLYAKTVTRLEINDTTGGFKCFRREVLESIDLNKVKSDGYCFQIEMNYIVSIMGYSMLEVPIVFEDRKEGASKMGMDIIMESLVRVLLLPFKKVSDYSKKSRVVGVKKTSTGKAKKNKENKSKQSEKKSQVKKTIEKNK